MQKKGTYWLLVLFVGFIIFQDASSAGTTANKFFGWLFDSVAVAGDFLGGVFGEDGAEEPTQNASTTPSPQPTVTETVTTQPSDPFADDPIVEEPAASESASEPTPQPTS